jgi:hypothetical protein
LFGLTPIWCFEENGLVGYGGGVYVREKGNNCFSVCFASGEKEGSVVVLRLIY